MITNLNKLFEELPNSIRQVANRMYRILVMESQLNLTHEMSPWVEDQFGSLNFVKEQTIIRVINKVTGEASLFNPLRSSRPLLEYKEQIEDEIGNDYHLFRQPLKFTPEDPFGRLIGSHGITSANLARYPIVRTDSRRFGDSPKYYPY